MTKSSPSSLSVAVFCGSKPGVDPRHMATAEALGRGMAARGMRLIYGGGKVGIMGKVAETVRVGGGEVVGVIPEFLMKREAGDTSIPLEVTDSMHTRKRRMFDLADAFVSLAGGLGTLDETVEIVTWKQLGLHSKPILVLNDGGFWRGFEAMVKDFTDTGFAGKDAGKLFQMVESVDAAFCILDTLTPGAGEAISSRL